MRKSLMRMTLRQLQIFNEVCDVRSYSRAAEEMSLTQPAVSLQIRQLEELIGQPLFDYVGKKLYMTEAAEALQRASRDIFGRLENLDMQLSDMQGMAVGVGIDRDRANAHLGAGTHDSYGNLTTVGDQDLCYHLEVPLSRWHHDLLDPGRRVTKCFNLVASPH